MTVILTAIAFLLGTFGLVHQRIYAGVWFQWEQFWHHEPLIAICFTVAITLLIAEFGKRKGAK